MQHLRLNEWPPRPKFLTIFKWKWYNREKGGCMKDGIKVILVVLAATLIFQLPIFAANVPANLTVPKSWVSLNPTGTSGPKAYATSADFKEALSVTIRTISKPEQSALQWANDEAEYLESQGVKILIPPIEITVNKKPWVKLETLLSKTGRDGETGTARNEQYFAKQGSDLIVEVIVMGREANFNAANRQGIEELLSSFNSEAKAEASQR